MITRHRLMRGKEAINIPDFYTANQEWCFGGSNTRDSEIPLTIYT
jgi:hypothetical protein